MNKSDIIMWAIIIVLVVIAIPIFMYLEVFIMSMKIAIMKQLGVTIPVEMMQ